MNTDAATDTDTLRTLLEELLAKEYTYAKGVKVIRAEKVQALLDSLV